MGIPTDPGYRLYVDDNICFPAGKTPKKLFLSIQNVKCGSAWDNTHPAPPNQTFLLEYDGGLWTFNGATWTASVYMDDFVTEVYVTPTEQPYPAYKSTITEGCKFSGQSEFPEYLPLVYVLGNHVISPRD